MNEPGILLTPPAKGTPADDGILAASEVAALKLNADWVILSACNTAAPDGTPGAEALSGLARAFFHAGTRSLLVSHWPVYSDAGRALVTGALAEAGKGVPRAEALRRSMVAMFEKPAEEMFSHPMFWAPFALVGEGGAPVAASSAAPAPAPIAATSSHKTLKPANIRAEPSAASAKVASLPAGEAVEVMNEAGEWLLIGRDGAKLGYVHKSLVGQ